MSWVGLDDDALALAVPALGSLALDPCLGLAQTAIVGQLCGTQALAALGVCEGLFGLLLRLCNFLQYATAPLVAAAASKGESEAQQDVVAQAVWLALMLGVAVAIGILVAAEQALDCKPGSQRS